MKPLLSLVSCGRNDNYMGNFLWRIETALNFSARGFSATGRPDDVEFVIVDWGSEVPLHEVLKLNDAAKRMTRFVRVPPRVAKENDRDSSFAGVVAVNTGIRRSRGKFIAQTGGDILYEANVAGNLFDVLEGKRKIQTPPEKTLFFLPLKNIPYEIANRCPDLGFIEEYVDRHGSDLPVKPLGPFLYGGAGTLVMHRDLWSESRGFDETLIHWGGSDNDLKLRICLKYSAMELGRKEGIAVYHLDHYPPGNASVAVTNRLPFNPISVNGADWGLASFRFDEVPRSDGTDVSMPPGEPSAAAPGNYRFRHFTNLLGFALTHMDRESLKTSRDTLIWMIRDLPEASIIRKTFMMARNILRPPGIHGS